MSATRIVCYYRIASTLLGYTWYEALSVLILQPSRGLQSCGGVTRAYPKIAPST